MTGGAAAILPRGMPGRQVRLLRQLALTPSLTRLDYQTLVGISHTTAKQDLTELLAAGLIDRYGRGRSCRYSLSAQFPVETAD
ncbi:MAG TPA: helix-turn-helix transcriptional regulator [Chloroflexota bacterium]